MSRDFSSLAPPQEVEQFQLKWEFVGAFPISLIDLLEDMIEEGPPPNPDDIREFGYYLDFPDYSNPLEVHSWGRLAK